MSDGYTSQWRTEDKDVIKSKFPSLFSSSGGGDCDRIPQLSSSGHIPSVGASTTPPSRTSPRLSHQSTMIESGSPTGVSYMHNRSSPQLLSRIKLVTGPGGGDLTSNRTVTTTTSNNTTVHRTITRTTKNGKSVTTNSIDNPSITNGSMLMKRSLIKTPSDTDNAMMLARSNMMSGQTSTSSSQSTIKKSSTTSSSSTKTSSTNGQTPQSETFTTSKFEENTSKNVKTVKIGQDGSKSIDKTEQKSHKLDENERRTIVDYKGAKTDTKIENTKKSDHLRRLLKMKPRRSKSDVGTVEDAPKVYEEHNDEETHRKVEAYQPLGQDAPDISFEASSRRTKGNNLEQSAIGSSDCNELALQGEQGLVPTEDNGANGGGYHTLTSMLTGFVSGATNKAWCMVQNAYEVAYDYYSSTELWNEWEDSSSDEDEDYDDDAGSEYTSDPKAIGYQSQQMIMSANQKSRQEAQEKLEKNKRRCFLIVQELCKTEEDYVRKLHILLKVSERVSEILTPEIARDMFFDIDVIHKFHHDNLLPELKDRVNNWSTKPAIGDIMKRLAPFLKLTTDYVQHFEKATELLETYQKKSSSFASFMKKAVTLPEYGKMPIQSHMIEPVQRIPRYGLLLRDYINHLPSDSPDLEDSKKAQELVEEAAMHFESMMKRNSVLGQLLKVQRQLDSHFGIVSPTRELIKEGKLSKISVRNGKPIERYAFLFNDLLLLCSSPSLSRGKRYKVKNVVVMAEIQVSESENKNVANSFYLRTTEKVIELSTNKASEKKTWQNIIWKQVGECTKDKLRHLKTDNEAITLEKLDINRKSIGKRAPVLLRQKDFNKCRLCAGEFTTMRRKHNCRGCGIVICAKCSSHTAKLSYDKHKIARLCDECFVAMFDQGNHKYSSKGSMAVPVQHNVEASKIIEKMTFLFSGNNGKSFKKRCCQLNDDSTLCIYKGQEDIHPFVTLRMDSTTTEKDETSVQKRVVLKLHTERKMYLLSHEDHTVLDRWFKLFKGMQCSTPV